MGGLTIYALWKVIHSDNSNPDEHVSNGHHKHHEPFAITPVVSPTGAGATFRVEW